MTTVDAAWGSSEIAAAWPHLPIHGAMLHRVHARHGLGPAHGSGSRRTFSDAELCGLWVALQFHSPGVHWPALHFRMVDNAVQAMVAAPAPWVVTHPDDAFTCWTVDDVAAGGRRWPVFTVVRLDLTDEALQGALWRAAGAYLVDDGTMGRDRD